MENILILSLSFTILYNNSTEVRAQYQNSVKMPQCCKINDQASEADLCHLVTGVIIRGRTMSCSPFLHHVLCTCITIHLYIAPMSRQNFPLHVVGENLSVARNLLFPLLTFSQKKKKIAGRRHIYSSKTTSNSASAEQI